MRAKKNAASSKGVFERLQFSLQKLAASKMVLVQESHTVLRCHYVNRKGFTRPIIQEVSKEGGDKTGYEIADIAKGIQFQWQVRVDTEKLKRFRTAFGIRRRELKIKGEEIKIVVWQHKDSEDCRNIHADLYPLLLKYRPHQPGETQAEFVDEEEQLTGKIDGRKLHRMPQTERCVQQIYSIFDGAGMGELEATSFEDLNQFFSKPIIMRAKRALGISSIKRSGKWWWLPPDSPPDAAMKIYHAERLEAAAKERRHVPKPRFDEHYIDRPSTQQLKLIMTRENFDCPVSIVKAEMAPYKRITILKAKQLLKIARFKIDKTWRWVYPAPEAREWLHEQLARGPVKQETLFHRAMHQKKWTREVLRVIKRIDPNIRVHMEGQELCWKLDGAVDFGLQPDEMIEAVPIKPVVEKVAQPIQGFKIALFGDDDE